MTNSALSSNPGADVRAYLADFLPSARLTDAVVSAEHQPLLFMQTKRLVSAFAFANGDIRESYDALYGGFKKYYADQKGQWDNLDLAFVFCIQTGFLNLDQFCSNVETDVYFCRKFVIPLTATLGSSLARLPFLPLTPLNGQSVRPPSAQTYLQQCGVPAVLARYLVVQQVRSPEGIVEDCTTGKFGESRTLTAASTTSNVATEQTNEPVRIDTMEIHNFRAYRRSQTFSLGADVTVLYGPNGFGKTSFFDAVDFAITGGIGRIESSQSRRRSEFAKIARHLDAGSEESTVSLTFRKNGAARKIIRSVNDRNQAVLDDRPTDRKAILSEVTGGTIPPADRVENFVDLFRASHLFSQEQQELTRDFQDDCQLSAEVVSRMLAFEDYVNAANKAARVRDVLKSTVAGASDEIKILTEQLKADSEELERLGQTAREHTNIGALDAEIDALRAKLVTVGVMVPPEKTDVMMVRGWRAALESRHSQSRATSNRLDLLANEVAGLPRTQAEIAAIKQQMREKEESLNAVEEKRIAHESAIPLAEQRHAEMMAKRIEAQAHADLLEWVRNTQPAYAQLTSQQRELDTQLQRAKETLVKLRSAEDKATSELRSMEAAAAQVTEKLNAYRADLTKARTLEQTIPVWQGNRTRLSTVLESEQEQFKALELLRAEERELTPLLVAVTAEELRLAREVAEFDKNQSELRKLVSQLQTHVSTGTCPLCGEDHGSKDNLLQRIQSHVAADAASGARSNLNEVRERNKQLFERVAANKQKQQASEGQLSALKSERAKLETEIAHFTTAASKLAVAGESAGTTPDEQVHSFAARIQQELTVLEKDRQTEDAAVVAAHAAVADAKNVVVAAQAEVDDNAAALARTQEEINHLRSDSRLTQVSLDIDPAQLAELEQLNLKSLDEFKTEAAKAESEANRKRPELAALRQEAISLKSQIEDNRTQLGSLEKIVAQVVVRMEESELPLDSNEQTLLALIAEQSRLQSQLLVLRDATSSLELALDAATTAAALTSLREAVRNRETALAQMEAKRILHLPWRKYFEDVSRLLAAKQNEAIANFTHEYGPRTSDIQRRLRSVYGFDEIEIRSQESKISVRVKRHGEVLRPTDYFSQSQQQTLLLGLFLTACSSQSWSLFSPVFLDDPVTHFDEVNRYAFLDLVDGLLDDETKKRQFIISTCDEKLLQLARQKFRQLGEGAKFYRFTSIGADGPTVEEIC